MTGQLIHDKLITDFKTFDFEGGNTMFNNVEKFYAGSTMGALDCLIVPDSNLESVEGGSAGNTQTTREYAFRAVVIEVLEETDSKAEGSLKYSRLMNVTDAILNYVQKEPSNLRAWGLTNDILIFKTRIRNVRYDTVKTKSGYAVLLEVIFGVYLNVVPQNL